MTLAGTGVAPLLTTEDLLSRLSNGQWALPGLLPLFHQAIQEATGATDVSLTALTMLRYGLAETIPDPLAVPADLVERRSDLAVCQFWDGVASRIVSGTRYQPASDQDIQSVHEAIDRIGDVAPLTRTALGQTIAHVVRLDGASFGSASHPWLFGCLFCSAATLADGPEIMAETLIHELAHHELFLLNLVDRLVLPDADHDQQFAPFQNRLRPTIGRLHSAHALFRMIEYQRMAGGSYQQQAQLLARTLDTLPARLLTPFGARLVHAASRSWPRNLADNEATSSTSLRHDAACHD